MLGVKTIIHLSPERFEDLDKNFECHHIEVKLFNKELELIDLGVITDMVENAINDKKGPVFLFCVNGFLSSAIACSYLMRTNKVLNKELAMASIMSKRYENKDMPGWVY